MEVGLHLLKKQQIANMWKNLMPVSTKEQIGMLTTKVFSFSCENFYW